jgi:hypothetical protein
MGRISISRYEGANSKTTKSTHTNLSSGKLTALTTATTREDPKAIFKSEEPKSTTDSAYGPNGSLSKVVPITGLYGYRWNLPPHQWSLPIEPSNDPIVANSEPYALGSLPRYRRGRIYWYSSVNTEYTDGTYNTGTDSGKESDTSGHSKDPRYGFQFLWNPDQFSTSVAVNLDVTPSFADKYVGVVGAFPSGEYLTVTVRLDRTNDFACIKSIPKGTPNTGVQDVYKSLSNNYRKFYDGSQGFDSSITAEHNIGNKIWELQKYGTIADLEYLYKAINGPGWVNKATNSNSSDIGFLKPTLLRIDIGPLSYLGYVNNMTVNHIAFSKGMIPIRTDVSLQFNLMATAGLSSK